LTKTEFSADRENSTYLHGVVLLDVGVGVANSPTVVGDNVGHLVLAERFANNLAEFQRRFLFLDADCLVAALNVVEDAEVFARLVDGDNVHETKGEAVVTPDFVVDLDVVALVTADLKRFHAVEGVLQPLTEKGSQGQALSQLVGSSRRTGGVHSLALVKEPILGRKHALHMLLRTSCLYNEVSLRACN